MELPEWLDKELEDEGFSDRALEFFSTMPKPEFSQKYLDAKEALLKSVGRRSRVRKMVLAAVIAGFIMTFAVCIKTMKKG